MKFLLLGYSSIARRRVLPALSKLGVESIDVASCSSRQIAWPESSCGRLFCDYREALEASDADVVYVSTSNHLHAPLVESALESGRHTVVDKPAFLSLADANRLTELAECKGLTLAEATVYPFHSQIEAIRKSFTESCAAPTRLSAVFSVPPLPTEDFRYRAEFGGGALLDLGPYAVTPGRIFFGEPPEAVICRVLTRSCGVDTSFSLLMTYSNGKSLVGHYGYTTGYRNRLEILGPDATATLDRVFTTPPDLALDIEWSEHNRGRILHVPACDAFGAFLGAFLQSVREGDRESWRRILLDDAAVLNRLRFIAGELPSEK